MKVPFFRVPLIIRHSRRINFGLASKMIFILWCGSGGFLLHMFQSEYLTMLIKPIYEKPIDTAQDVLDRGLTVIWPPGLDSDHEYWKNSPSKIRRQFAERIIVAKVIFC